MYIQDKNQKIVGNLDIPAKWDESYDSSQMWTVVVILPQIGAFVTYKEEPYIILSTTTYQEDVANPTYTTMCRIYRINDEGDDLPIEPITVKADELTLI